MCAVHSKLVERENSRVVGIEEPHKHIGTRERKRQVIQSQTFLYFAHAQHTISVDIDLIEPHAQQSLGRHPLYRGVKLTTQIDICIGGTVRMTHDFPLLSTRFPPELEIFTLKSENLYGVVVGSEVVWYVCVCVCLLSSMYTSICMCIYVWFFFTLI